MRPIGCLLLVFSVLPLASCTMITVDPTDTSAPEFTIQMPAPRLFAATYTDDGAAVGETIDVSRTFRVTVPHDRRIVSLLITAVDQESGIYQVRGRLEIRFKCRARVFGVTEEKMAGAQFLNFSNPNPPVRADPGSSTPDSKIVSVNFTLEDLWRQGNCTRWPGFLNVNRGELSDIQVLYSSEAWNNRYPDPISFREISGSFTRLLQKNLVFWGSGGFLKSTSVMQ